MENKNNNKRIAIYIAVLIALLGGSFIIYKIASASINNAVISRITLTSIETGNNIDPEGEDNLVTTCESEDACFSTYTASKDSSKENILVKSFDKIKYNFNFNIVDSSDSTHDIDDVTINLKVNLSEEDKKYVSFDGINCSNDGLCIIRNNSSYEASNYSVTLNVNNAPNGYEIKPTFTFDVEDNKLDTPVVLGYNELSETNYYYSYLDGTYSFNGPDNKMPTIVSSSEGTISYVLYPNSSDTNFTQGAKYDGKDGRFITYLLGIKTDGSLSGTYYPSNEITFKINFSQDNSLIPIVQDNWIRFYDNNIVDSIRPITYSLPYSILNLDSDRSIRRPGNISISKNGYEINVKVSDFDILLDGPSKNANDTDIDGSYISTLAITNFSPRGEADGQNVINNTITLSTIDNQLIGTRTIENSYEQVAVSSGNNLNEENSADIVTSSSWYDESETTPLSLRNGGSGSVSKGTIVKYITKFKNNKTSLNSGLKEVIKFDTYAYRVLPYDTNNDIDIRIKCGTTDCKNISSDDFDIKFVSGSFDYFIDDIVQYELNDISSLKLSDNDKSIASACSNIDLTSLNKDQIQNLYGGPCIKAKDNIETIFDKISDATKVSGDTDTEIPISKIIVQTKKGVTLPDGAEVTAIVKARVRNVSDLTHNYQATTMISTSDYDNELYYYAPQINEAISKDNYIKTAYVGNTSIDSYDFIGDSLKIVNFTLRQNISVTNKNSDGSLKTKYRTTNNEIITYKLETSLSDNSMDLQADDTWYIKKIYTYVYIPKTLEYVPDDGLIKPDMVIDDINDTVLKYTIVSSGDKIKANMKIKDIYFKTKLSPKLSGQTTNIVVRSYPEGENINGEIDTTIRSGKMAEFTIQGTGINEVIGSISTGNSGSVIEKDGTIDYVLNAYNNTGDDVNDYKIIDVLPYNRDNNNSSFNGSYSVKITSDLVNLDNIKCTKVSPNEINKDNDDIWKSCGDIKNSFVSDITGIKIDNISIEQESSMDEIIISLKTKDNKSSDKYNNSFKGYASGSNENVSNVVEVSVVNRTISGIVFLDEEENGVKEDNESFIKDVPVTLYKISETDELDKVADTTTDENGYYEFNNLEKGRYKIRAKYDVNKYDLTLRYATEDTSKDSDAYLIDSNGTIEISDKNEASKGLLLSEEINELSNMDIGLTIKHTFGFVMSKYITRIDLSNNGLLTTTDYDNLSKVSINVINPKKYTAKVYYGISITNNSNKAGYINLVKEDIPNGFIFDKNYPENAGWFEMNGMLGNRSLETKLVRPNETVYLQIVLFLPARDEAGSFINTASVAEVTEFNPTTKVIKENEYVNSDEYQVGDSLRYAGVNFHVIGAVPNGNEQILTLLADSNQTSLNHLPSNGVYKWSNSIINNYINNEWINLHNINPSSLIPFNICDDASGLFNSNANGGVVDANSCASNIYTTSNARLLTQAEFNTLINNLTDSSFLFNGDFWLMDAVYASNGDYNEYGELNANYDTSNLVKYVNSSSSSVLPVQGTSGFDKNVNVTSKLQVRPVIRISTNNIILE